MEQVQLNKSLGSIEIFKEYFVDKSVPSLQDVVQNALVRLKEGHIATELSQQELEVLQQSKYVCSGSGVLDKPFVVYNGKFYLQRYFLYETQIVQKIELLRQQAAASFEERLAELVGLRSFVDKLFSDFESEGSAEERINWQMVAALNSSLEQFSIITGGPGTGKTTTVAKLLAVLYKQNSRLTVCLAAQTGKAAARLKESLNNSKSKLECDDFIKIFFDKIKPLTIHRLLGFVPGSVDFRHNRGNSLPYDVIIVDESSMVDVPLMAKLFEAVSVHSKIILLGDKNQLASVEAGSIFGDLCKSAGDGINNFPEDKVRFFNSLISKGKVPDSYVFKDLKITSLICELKKSYRFKSDSDIGNIARKILNGKDVDYSEYAGEIEPKGVFLREKPIDADIHAYLLKYKEYTQEDDIKKALVKFNEVKVLCASRSGSFGVEEMNIQVEKYLIEKKIIKRKDGEFYENRPILITKNDYSLGLFNGDVGICRTNQNGDMKVYFDDSASETGLKEIEPSFMQSFETVFAMTIHKSQGSEFTHVLLYLPQQGKAEALLTRELLYTGVTRGKDSVLIVSEKEVLQQAIATPVQRVSGVIDRL